MASTTTEDAEAAVELLEAALERIARLTARPSTPDSGLPIEEVRERLDQMIERLRAALDDDRA